jgi:hypothetical protein
LKKPNARRWHKWSPTCRRPTRGMTNDALHEAPRRLVD